MRVISATHYYTFRKGTSFCFIGKQTPQSKNQELMISWVNVPFSQVRDAKQVQKVECSQMLSFYLSTNFCRQQESSPKLIVTTFKFKRRQKGVVTIVKQESNATFVKKQVTFQLTAKILTKFKDQDTECLVLELQKSIKSKKAHICLNKNLIKNRKLRLLQRNNSKRTIYSKLLILMKEFQVIE